MQPTHQEHRATAPKQLGCAVITVSDTRTLDNDTGGAAVVSHLETAGVGVVQRDIIPDEPARMRLLLMQLAQRADVDAILLTGGTGITSRDLTYETVSSLFTKLLPGYGEVFRLLSYQQIGAAAILSRAVGGLVGQKVVLTMPGSPAAVNLAMEQIIIPELAHLVREARR